MMFCSHLFRSYEIPLSIMQPSDLNHLAEWRFINLACYLWHNSTKVDMMLENYCA